MAWSHWREWKYRKSGLLRPDYMKALEVWEKYEHGYRLKKSCGVWLSMDTRGMKASGRKAKKEMRYKFQSKRIERALIDVISMVTHISVRLCTFESNPGEA